MSQESSKVITRQWRIIQFLLDSKYVSTAEIEKYLKDNGIETTQRTIQRDLNLLETLFLSNVVVIVCHSIGVGKSGTICKRIEFIASTNIKTC